MKTWCYEKERYRRLGTRILLKLYARGRRWKQVKSDDSQGGDPRQRREVDHAGFTNVLPFDYRYSLGCNSGWFQSNVVASWINPRIEGRRLVLKKPQKCNDRPSDVPNSWSINLKLGILAAVLLLQSEDIHNLQTSASETKCQT